MGETSVIRHRVVLPDGDKEGPPLTEFYVRSVGGGVWEVFLSSDLANTSANYGEKLERNEKEALKNADVKLAQAVKNEPAGFVSKVFEVVGLNTSSRFFAIDENGDIAMASLGTQEEASDVAVIPLDEISSEAVSQVGAPKI